MLCFESFSHQERSYNVEGGTMMNWKCAFGAVSVSFLIIGCGQKPIDLEPVPAAVTENSRDSGKAEDTSPSDILQDRSRADEQILADGTKLNSILFDFDSYRIREDQVSLLTKNATVLKNADTSVLIEGHCDERGTEEYNIALGQERATATKQYLVSLGVDDSRIRTITFGEGRPAATGHDEDSWSQNRRAEFLQVDR